MHFFIVVFKYLSIYVKIIFMEVNMKKLGLLLVTVMAFLVMPLTVFADEASSDDTQSQESQKVKLYFFHGNGCPHCAEAEEFFDSIQDEYGDKFEIVAYETWYDSSNAELLQKVGDARDENITGVPYILIGNKSWSGYTSSYGDEIIEAIKSEYEKPVDERYDIMKLIGVDGENNKKDYSTDTMILIIMLVIAGATAFGIITARNKTA